MKERYPLQYKIATATEGATSRNEDRAAIIEIDSGYVVVVADGAGGTSGGDIAADAAMQFVREYVLRAGAVPDPVYWCRVLTELDEYICSHVAAGECTVALVFIDQASVCGASIGDSGAYIITDSTLADLTAKQKRKPLCGSGGAVPVPFGPVPLHDTLVIASDGLFKYAKWSDIHRAVKGSDVNAVARSLIDSARLSSGELQDDIVVVVCRVVEHDPLMDAPR